MFTKSFYLLRFDLTSDKEADEVHIRVPHQVNMCIGARFKRPLPEPVICILYDEFPGHIPIDNCRNLTVE